MISKIRALQTRQAGRLNNLNVTPLDQPGDFAVTTSQVNKTLVKSLLTNAFPDAEISEPQVDEIVNRAILEAFAGKLEIQQSLKPQIASEEKIDEKLIEAAPELADFIGGIKITCKIAVPATGAQIERRFGDLRFKPDMRDLNWGYDHVILDADLNELQPDRAVDSFVYVSAEQDAGLREISEDEWERFSQNERQKVLAAAQLETSLPRVTQIDPSVGAEAKTRAMIAVVLSLFAIVAYIWVRFGNLRYGLAAIMALVHDVCITLGAVTACTYIASNVIGERLLIGDFKIDLAMIAAFLTLIGYSLNDTIVVFDRIRENRKKTQEDAFLTLIGYSLNDTIVVFDRIRENRKKTQEDARIISESINQTISRTLLTSFTTFIVVFIMYIFGGAGLRGFTFAIGFGIIIGTYSSIAIAAPLLLLARRTANKTRR
jgi:SecD/SecF fusion protein